jgi:hypothetical protein
MAEMTEIYSCRGNQELKDGKYDYSYEIRDRQDAESDARLKCDKDPTIRKIAYYLVNDSGDYRNIFTYSNPEYAGTATPAKAAPKANGAPEKAKSAPLGGSDTTRPAAPKARKTKAGLLGRLKDFLSEEV